MNKTNPADPRSDHGARVRRRAFLLMGVAIFCFGTLWPATKLGLREATPVWYAVGRMGLGSIVAFALLTATRQLRKPGRADLPLIFSVGGLQFAAFAAFANIGLRYVPAGRSIVLAYTTTLWLVPLALMVRERIGPWRATGTAVGIVGIAILCNPLALDWGDRRVVLGNASLLFASLLWALSIFHTRQHRWRLAPLQLLPWQLLLATVLLVPVALVLEPHGGMGSSRTTLLCLAYIGLIAGPLANWTAMMVARDLPLVTTSLGFLMVPVLGMTISALWLGEVVPPVLLAGAAFILLGLAFVTLGTLRGR